MAREETRKSNTVSEVEYRRGNAVTSLKRARVNKSIKGKAPIYKLNTKNLPLQIGAKNKWTLFYCTTWASTLAPAIIL